jgi:hypothetical protein
LLFWNQEYDVCKKLWDLCIIFCLFDNLNPRASTFPIISERRIHTKIQISLETILHHTFCQLRDLGWVISWIPILRIQVVKEKYTTDVVKNLNL